MKWKEGERIALRWLSEEIKDKISPLLNIMKDTKPDTFPSEINKNWGIGRQFYLDFHSTFEDDPIEFLSIMFEEEDEAKNLAFIPVISPDTPSEYLQLLQEKIDLSTRGIALRVTPQALEDVSYEETLNQVKIDKKVIDLIVDLQNIEGLPMTLITTLAETLCFLLGNTQAFAFRSVTVAGASFPDVLRNIPRNSVKEIPRKEWLLWEEIYKRNPHVNFGDFGPDDPHVPAYEPGITIVPTIRYTHKHSWYIIRGSYDPRAPYDYTQYHALAQKLVNLPQIFCGEDFSWGDAKILECASQPCTSGISKCNHGSPRTWVQINTNHHLTYVARQIASFASSSDNS